MQHAKGECMGGPQIYITADLGLSSVYLLKVWRLSWTESLYYF